MEGTMKVCVLTGQRQLEWTEREIPQPAAGELQIKLEYVGICGSDLHFFDQGRLANWELDGPLALGHEPGGVVTAIGEGVTGFEVGDKVAIEPAVPCGKCEACRTGHYNLCPDVKMLAIPHERDGVFSEYCTHDATMCYKLPENMDTMEGGLLEPLTVFIVTVLVGIAVHIATGNFFTSYNISTLSRAASFAIIVGFGQTIVLLTGGIDLSVATIGQVCGMASAIFMVNYGMNPYLAIIIASLMGIVLGAVNGFFIAYFKMTPFIVTLATMQIYKGIVYVITKGMPITGMPENAQNLANGIIGGVLPKIVVMMILICVILTVMLNRTKFGRHIYALGGNRKCAKIVGIPTEKVEMLVYCLSGLLAAFAGVMMACKLASFQASIGESWQMDSITAAVLGGTSMAGGIGTVVGTIFGGLLSSVISTCITLLRISSYWQTIVTGAVVLIAVLIDAVKDNPAIQEKIQRKRRSKGKN